MGLLGSWSSSSNHCQMGVGSIPASLGVELTLITGKQAAALRIKSEWEFWSSSGMLLWRDKTSKMMCKKNICHGENIAQHVHCWRRPSWFTIGRQISVRRPSMTIINKTQQQKYLTVNTGPDLGIPIVYPLVLFWKAAGVKSTSQTVCGWRARLGTAPFTRERVASIFECVCGVNCLLNRMNSAGKHPSNEQQEPQRKSQIETKRRPDWSAYSISNQPAAPTRQGLAHIKCTEHLVFMVCCYYHDRYYEDA